MPGTSSPRVFINIVAWNSMAFIPDLLRSLFEQTFTDFQVLVIDNGSSDGVERFVREQYPQVSVLRNAHNLGFSPAHNQGIRYALGAWTPQERPDRFVLVTNPDIILTPTFLERLIREAERHPRAGSLGGKLLRAFSEHPQDEALAETVRSNRIDSTGLQPHRNRTFTDRGAGELDGGQYDGSADVFGVSGALALLRASALEDVRYQDEFFDQDFFAYKEDVDLAWRLQHLGWRARYAADAVAYHHRGMYGQERAGLVERILNRRRKSRRRSYYSTRNHWNMLMKNERTLNALFAAPWIGLAEGARLGYVCLLETGNVPAFFEAVVRAPRMWAKRRHTLSRLQTSARDMRRWFV